MFLLITIVNIVVVVVVILDDQPEISRKEEEYQNHPRSVFVLVFRWIFETNLILKKRGKQECDDQ